MHKMAKFLLSFAAAIPTTISAAENVAPMTLDPISVTGELSTFGVTKSETPILETARSVSVIRSERFQERGAQTLDDTLDYTAGVVGDTFGYSTRGDFPRVRGLTVPEYLDNIQVLFGFYNNTRTELYTLDQVEVLKGPASVLYGNGSPGGILNAISKQASRDYLDREIVISGGTHDRFQIATDLGFDLSGNGNLTGRIVALSREADTQIDFVEDNALVFAPSLTFDNGRTRVTALANYSDRETGTAHQFTPLSVSGCGSSKVQVSNPAMCAGVSGKTVDSDFYAGDPNFNRYDAESFSLTLYGEHQINDIFSAEATARYRDAEVDYGQTWISFQGSNPGTLNFPPLIADGTAIGRTWYDAPSESDQLAIDARLRAEFDLGNFSHQLMVGFSHQNIDTNRDRSQLTYPTAAAAAAFFPRGLPTTFNVFSPVYDGSEVPSAAAFDAVRIAETSDVDTRGFYVNDQIEFGHFVFNAGLRYDDIENTTHVASQDDNETTYSAGLLYRTSMGLNPYISYAESFDAVIGVDTLTGQPYRPQEGKQTEIGLKYQPARTRTYITLAWFDLEQNNQLDPLVFPGSPAQQNGTNDIKGVEIEGETTFGDFHIQASLSILDTENEFGEDVQYLPEKQASAWVTWIPSSGPLSRLRLGGGIRYASDNESNGLAFLLPNPLAPTVEKVTTDGYTVADALIAYDFDQVSIALNVRNLFDREYYGTCSFGGACFAAERRTAVGTVTYHF